MFFYLSALCISVVLYSLALLRLRSGLARLRVGVNEAQPRVSVVIPAKDEAENVQACLEAVLNQRYPEDRIEVILVDDRSDDDTWQVADSIARQDTRVKVLRIQDRLPHLAPKKRALDLGVRQASGKVVVTTDADCRPGPEWLAGLMQYFEPDVGLVAGFNPYQVEKTRPSVFRRILALDYFAMACVAAATSGLGYPISCSGGNLAYRKEVFEQIGGFARFGNWISGDDDFFLEEVRSKTEWAIRYATNPKTFVPTAPPASFKEFWHQRLRYASKCARYQVLVTAGLAAVYALNLLIVLGVVVGFLFPSWLLICGSSLLLKAAAERSFLAKGVRTLQTDWAETIFWIAAALHPLYIVVVAAWGQIADFEWRSEDCSARLNARKKVLPNILKQRAKA